MANTTLLLQLLVLLTLIHFASLVKGQYSLCQTTFNSSTCPSNRAEWDSPSAMPSPCSSRGTCWFGACACQTGWGDMDCSKRIRRTKFGSAIITQAALDDAPTRYLDIVTETFNKLKSQNLEIPPTEFKDCYNYIAKIPLIPNWDISIELDYSTVKLQIVNGGIKAWSTFNISIPNIPLDAYVSMFPGSPAGTCCTPSNVSIYSTTATCTAACVSSAGGFVSVKFQLATTAVAYPMFNYSSGEIAVDVPQGLITTALAPADLGFQQSCSLSGYPLLLFNLYSQLVQPWGNALASKFGEAFRSTLVDIGKSFSTSSGRASNVTNATFTEIFVVDAAFHDNSHIAIKLEGLVRRRRFYQRQKFCPNVISTFVDGSLDENITTSTYFDTFFETAPTTPSAVTLQTLGTLRLTRSVLKACMWAALMDNEALIASVTGVNDVYAVLDATFLGSLDWRVPSLGFPASQINGNRSVNSIRWSMPSGSFQVICNNTQANMLGGQFALLTFDSQPIVLANFTSRNDPYFRMTGKINSWDSKRINMNVSAPVQLSIPNAMTRLILNQFMDDKIAAVNDLIYKLAPAVPMALTRYIPGARAEAMHDYLQPGSDRLNGYMEFRTRCACSTPTSTSTYVSFTTRLFGQEIVPKCSVPCVLSGRRLLSDSDVAAMGPDVLSHASDDQNEAFTQTSVHTASGDKLFLPTRLMHGDAQARIALGYVAPSDLDLPASYLSSFNAQKRQLATTNPFYNGGVCGDFADTVRLKAAASVFLTCITTSKLALLLGDANRFECMKKQETLPLTFGACDPVSQYYAFRNCPATARELYPVLFGYDCIEGNAFKCSDTLGSIYQINCACTWAKSEAMCSKLFIPSMVVMSGYLLAFISFVLTFLGIRCLSGAQTRQAMFFRVEMRSRDKMVVRLGLFCSLLCAFFCIGWVQDDPFRRFAENILSSNLFQFSPWITSTFDLFLVVWSLLLVFFVAFTSSFFFGVVCFSFYVGRCVWIVPTRRYERNGQWFVPSTFAIRVWEVERFFTQSFLRFFVLIALSCLVIPPLFFPFRKSVVIHPPQFGIDYTSQVTANLTSFATSPRVLEDLEQIVGFTIMSKAIGFLSVGFIYGAHGAAPAAFTSAHFMVHLMDRREDAERKDYEKFKNILPPADTNDLDRWRRILSLFIWCSHATGTLGSLVGVILVYQSLKAPYSWALAWLMCWILTIPCVMLGSSKRYRLRFTRYGGLILVVVYDSLFILFTTILIITTPTIVGFSIWFGAVLCIVTFTVFSLVLLGEFINVADSLRGRGTNNMRAAVGRYKLMAKMGLDVDGNPDIVNNNLINWNVLDASPRVQGGESPLKQRKAPPPINSMQLTSFKLGVSDEDAMMMAASSSASPKSTSPKYNAPRSLANAEQGGDDTSSANPLFRMEKERVQASAMAPLSNRPPLSEEERMMQMLTQRSTAAPLMTGSLASSSLQSRPQNSSRPAPLPGTETNLLRQLERGGDEVIAPDVMSQAADRMRRRVMRESVRLGAGGLNIALAQQQQQQQWQAQQQAVSGKQATAKVTDSAASSSSRRPQAKQHPEDFLQLDANLTLGQRREQERMRRRVSKRLAARGVQGDAAKQLTDQIVRYNLIRQMESQAQDTVRAANPMILRGTNVASNAAVAALTGPGNLFQKKPSGTSNSMMGTAPPRKSPAYPNVQRPSSPGPSSPKPGVSSPKPGASTSKPGAPASKSGASALPQKVLQKQPSENKLHGNKVEDQYAAQFDPNNAYVQPATTMNLWDGDDSFASFLKEIVVQVKNALVSAFWETKRLLAMAGDSAKETVLDLREAGVKVANEYAVDVNDPEYRFRQRVGRNQRFKTRLGIWYRFVVKPILADVWGLITERKENQDPATYGIRIPGRRLLFMQGLTGMLIVLSYTSSHRPTEDSLKSFAISSFLTVSKLTDKADSGTYDWPGFSNLTAFLDRPLEVYVGKLNESFVFIWVIYVLWLFSFLVDVAYGTFGRDMEEKRQGIKFARWIGFIPLPLLLVFVLIPTAPDYVQLSVTGFANVIPDCADQLTALVIDTAGTLFGLAFSIYLAFQVYLVLMIICPSIARSFLFVITREILEMRLMNNFEPRKQFTLSQKRYKSARFVWRVFPFMSPILLYIPLLIVVQIIGELYSSFMIWFFLMLPSLVAWYGRTDDYTPRGEQVVTIQTWFWYNNLWVIVYFAPLLIVVAVESSNRGSLTFLVNNTLSNWLWWMQIWAALCIAIVIVSDVLYLFMTTEDELESDVAINRYLDAVREEAFKLKEEDDLKKETIA